MKIVKILPDNKEKTLATITFKTWYGRQVNRGVILVPGELGSKYWVYRDSGRFVGTNISKLIQAYLLHNCGDSKCS